MGSSCMQAAVREGAAGLSKALPARERSPINLLSSDAMAPCARDHSISSASWRARRRPRLLEESGGFCARALESCSRPADWLIVFLIGCTGAAARAPAHLVSAWRLPARHGRRAVSAAP